MARLILDTGGGKREIPVTGSTVLGRSPQVSVPVDDVKLSREHCSVCFDGAKFVVEDLASRNGTFVNGHKIVAPAQLYTGDEIKIGTTVIRFLMDPTDPGASTLRPSTGAVPAAAPAGHGGHAHAAQGAHGARSTHHGATALAAPNPAGRLFAWIALAALLAGGTWGMKHVFVWALHEIRP